jgi:hypothetical protein
MVAAGAAEHGVLFVRDAIRRQPELQRTEAFIKMTSTSRIGKLFTGQV